MVERSADDRLLALLARSVHALDRAEIAEVLGWSRARVGQVLLRLGQQGVIHGVPGKRPPGEAGRSPTLYALASRKLGATEADLSAPFVRGMRVITPSDREARVVGVRDGRYIEIEYIAARPGHEPRTVLHHTLLAPFIAGEERPDPVRISALERDA